MFSTKRIESTFLPKSNSYQKNSMAYRPGLKSDYQNLVYRPGEVNIRKGIIKKKMQIWKRHRHKVINKVKVTKMC